ncbi:hypothetical protein SAMN02799643_00971 [Methylobacterium sp. UNCCL125]|nr:hypothetical protein SAMN02799643_00971 [Methylobacterium sp. UNCCL125]
MRPCGSASAGSSRTGACPAADPIQSPWTPMGRPWAGRPRRVPPNPLIPGHDRPRPHGHAMGMGWGTTAPSPGSTRPHPGPMDPHACPWGAWGATRRRPATSPSVRRAHAGVGPPIGSGHRWAEAPGCPPGRAGWWMGICTRAPARGAVRRPRASPAGSIYPQGVGLFRHRTLSPFGHRPDPRQHQHPPGPAGARAPGIPPPSRRAPIPGIHISGQAPRPMRAARPHPGAPGAARPVGTRRGL